MARFATGEIKELAERYGLDEVIGAVADIALELAETRDEEEAVQFKFIGKKLAELAYQATINGVS